MQKRDKILLSIGALECLLVLVWLHFKAQTAFPPPKPLPVSATDVFDPKAPVLGNPRAPFTLVEFGDYECPACRYMYAQVERFCRSHADRLRFQFRQFPLTEIHPLAYRAALVAETARLQGRFWQVHALLYQQPLEQTLAKLSQKIDPRAKKLLAEDIAATNRLKLNHTPTFLLCLPDGRVLSLTVPQQAETYL
ncbi:DsbA family protein [Chthonomonas calidirosea]|uniref:DsbA family protein n=1 Tax=Chthonomonas calidirosea TaxID=454171 RepID=UPI0006EC47C6|nr:thioredoxin domain-containing protein [Chthonomonas calidirosea]CEK17991.1 protein-disulfide isomerase [Chthonomonas calidirosea]